MIALQTLTSIAVTTYRIPPGLLLAPSLGCVYYCTAERHRLVTASSAQSGRYNDFVKNSTCTPDRAHIQRERETSQGYYSTHTIGVCTRYYTLHSIQYILDCWLNKLRNVLPPLLHVFKASKISSVYYSLFRPRARKK